MNTEVLQSLSAQQTPIGIVGLGYVGLPLACLLAKKYRVVGFDIHEARVEELRRGEDRTKEIEHKAMLAQETLSFTYDAQDLKECQLIIVCVPTPIDTFKKPDLHPIRSASRTIGSIMRPGVTVVYESTVYPGVTETICRDELEKASGLKFGKDFALGYSPERVNPGDREHTIDKIKKIVSGSTPEVTKMLAAFYGSVVTAGIHEAPTIATAEAAKVIENVQRDLNIALINELAQLFERIGLNTLDVLAAAETKWNFLKFRPGLVGGHCIGVDPYYLTHLAEGSGIHPQVILAGRRINDSMGPFVAQKAVKMILSNRKAFATTAASVPIRVGILGVTFKENVPDFRNTKVLDVVEALEGFGIKTYLVDPVVDRQEFEAETGRTLTNWNDLPTCDAIIAAVRHNSFEQEFPIARIVDRLNETRVVLDLKGYLSADEASAQGVALWRL